MYKNRSILILGVLSILLVTVAVTSAFYKSPASVDLSWPPRPDYSHLNEKSFRSIAGSQDANDFYQRHPNWTWSVAAAEASSDYFQRHPELSASAAEVSFDLTDYYFRHLDK